MTAHSLLDFITSSLPPEDFDLNLVDLSLPSFNSFNFITILCSSPDIVAGGGERLIGFFYLLYLNRTLTSPMTLPISWISMKIIIHKLPTLLYDLQTGLHAVAFSISTTCIIYRFEYTSAYPTTETNFCKQPGNF